MTDPYYMRGRGIPIGGGDNPSISDFQEDRARNGHNAQGSFPRNTADYQHGQQPYSAETNGDYRRPQQINPPPLAGHQPRGGYRENGRDRDREHIERDPYRQRDRGEIQEYESDRWRDDRQQIGSLQTGQRVGDRNYARNDYGEQVQPGRANQHGGYPSRPVKQPKTFMSDYKPAELFTTSKAGEYRFPTIEVEQPSSNQVMSQIRTMIDQKKQAIQTSQKCSNSDYDEIMRKELIGQQLNIKKLRSLPVDYIVEYCSRSAEFFKKKLDEISNKKIQVQPYKDQIDNELAVLKRQIAPQVKYLKVQYAKSLNDILSYDRMGDPAPFEIAGVFPSQEEETKLKENWDSLEQSIRRCYDPFTRWYRKQEELTRRIQGIMLDADSTLQTSINDKLKGFVVSDMAMYEVFYSDQRVKLYKLLQSLQPKKQLHYQVVNIYINYLLKTYGTRLQHLKIKNTLQSDELSKSSRGYYMANNNQRIFSSSSKVVLMAVPFRNKRDEIVEYGLLMVKTVQRNSSADPEKKIQLIIYDPNSSRANDYHDYRYRIQEYIRLEYDRASGPEVEDNLQYNSSFSPTARQNNESGLYLLYYLTQAALHGLPEKCKLELEATQVENIRNRMRMFIKYLAYCNQKNQQRYPNMDYLEFCTKDLTSKP